MGDRNRDLHLIRVAGEPFFCEDCGANIFKVEMAANQDEPAAETITCDACGAEYVGFRG